MSILFKLIFYLVWFLYFWLLYFRVLYFSFFRWNFMPCNFITSISLIYLRCLYFFISIFLTFSWFFFNLATPYLILFDFLSIFDLYFFLSLLSSSFHSSYWLFSLILFLYHIWFVMFMFKIVLCFYILLSYDHSPTGQSMNQVNSA